MDSVEYMYVFMMIVGMMLVFLSFYVGRVPSPLTFPLVMWGWMLFGFGALLLASYGGPIAGKP